MSSSVSTFISIKIQTGEQRVKALVGFEVLKYDFCVFFTLITVYTVSQLWNRRATNVKWKWLIHYYRIFSYEQILAMTHSIFMYALYILKKVLFCWFSTRFCWYILSSCQPPHLLVKRRFSWRVLCGGVWYEIGRNTQLLLRLCQVEAKPESGARQTVRTVCVTVKGYAFT